MRRTTMLSAIAAVGTLLLATPGFAYAATGHLGYYRGTAWTVWREPPDNKCVFETGNGPADKFTNRTAVLYSHSTCDGRIVATLKPGTKWAGTEEFNGVIFVP
ncbi:hypothetical protein [Nonomuraea zeae]|uniref:Secreted protein n=1 Tax=Nonomuraea zeae TaxID=1642303 RepID=A0A5S4GFH2_9ACTN|nr:hypothetical protein [Nonomuraea zeae]TMR31716.1 hypothetical protein ETD85_24770 [Nonomuraea zeae]